MQVLDYIELYADNVECGVTTQSIRILRSPPFKVGDQLVHRAGYRTWRSRILLVSTCSMVRVIEISVDGVIRINGQATLPKSQQKFAKACGFKVYQSLLESIELRHGLPFKGFVVNWL